MEIRKDGLLLKKNEHPRSGWHKEILDEINEGGSPEVLIPDHINNDFEKNEWQLIH
ncbi:MAG: hypothetical protein ABFR36_01440 [Acidobacteriota bacterium]